MFIISGSADKAMKIFDINDKTELYCYENVHNGAIRSISISPNNELLISGSEDKSIKIFNFTKKN